MTDKEIFVIRISHSGDHFLVPLGKANDFWEDDLNNDADYAQYVDLEDLQIYDYEV